MKLVVRSNVDNTTEVVESLRVTVAEHLGREADIDDRTSHIEIVINDLQLSSDGDMNCRITVSGELNGVDVGHDFSAKRSFGESDNARIVRKTVTSGIAGLLAEALIPTPKIEFKLTPSKSRQLDALFHECTNDVLIHLDNTLRRKGSSSAQRWELFTKIKIIGAISVLVGNPLARALLVSRDEKNALGPFSFMGIFSTLVAALSVYMTIHVLGLLTMPASFFTSDPRGRKALTRTGVKSVLAMRIVTLFCVLLFAALAFVCGFVGILFH